MTDANAFVNGDGRRARFIIGEGATRDEITANQRWLSTRDPVDLGVWR